MVELGYHICICRCCDRSVRQEASGIQEGDFGKGKVAVFHSLQYVIAHVVGWVVVAPVLDIVIYAEPANKVFAQGAFAAVSNIHHKCCSRRSSDSDRLYKNNCKERLSGSGIS